MARISDDVLDTVRSRGFAVVEGFLEPELLDAARTAVFESFPHPDAYFAEPDRYADLVAHPFAGLRVGPLPQWDLNRIALHPDLVDAAERFCGTTDLQLYKIELWAKYSGAVDYDQPLHRDFGNHTLVVPRRDRRWPQLTTFTLLSDVTEGDGPTMAVPREYGDPYPMWPARLEDDIDLRRHEVPITGPAGSLLLYTTDVFHRGSAMTTHPASRFVLLADYSGRGNPWMGKIGWPDRALRPGWIELIERATPRQRQLLGFPAPGDPYWNDQTRREVALRYPDMDMTPYR
jgi:hypothetical protein